MRSIHVAILLGLVAACASTRSAENSPAKTPDERSSTTDEPVAAPPLEVPAEVRLTERLPADDVSCWLGHPCAEPPEGTTVQCIPPATRYGGDCPVPGCREGAEHPKCTSSAQCHEHQSCVPRLSCFPSCPPPPDLDMHREVLICDDTACKGDTDCRSPNLTCEDGRCRYRSCTSNDDCPMGYCVGDEGQRHCYQRTGSCKVYDPHGPKPA